MTEQIEKKPGGMQPALMVLNVLLLLAVAILFYLYFSRKDEVPVTKADNTQMPAMMKKHINAIAYVNTDVLLEKYLLVKKLSDQLSSERKSKDADFSKRQKEYQEEAAYFQESVQKQSLSEESAQKIYEQLMAKQEDLYSLQDQYSSELAKKEYEMNMTLLDSVKNYLDRLNKKYNFDYVLNYNTGGSILLAKDTFDITLPVLNGLNKEYLELYPPKQ